MNNEPEHHRFSELIEAARGFAEVEQAGEAIERFTEGMDYAAYGSDFRTQAAVERKFDIIGEALNILSTSNPELAERVPRTCKVIDFRNRLIHGYSSVIPGRVWDNAQNHLPQLRQVTQTLLAELGPPEE